MIEVSDDGPGILAEEIGPLFKPFSATSTRPTGDEKNTGLGLSIAKRLTEAHGGSTGVIEARQGWGPRSSSAFPSTLPNADFAIQHGGLELRGFALTNQFRSAEFLNQGVGLEHELRMTGPAFCRTEAGK